jgi:ABC-type glutathione transport system ATPase component
MVFQDPHGSLNPRLRIRSLLAEPLRLHKLTPPDREQSAVEELLRQVGLSPATSEKFPHELSGGQRQRVAIARALAVRPQLLVCDEPVSALDVSIQAQILNLLRDLQQDLGLSYFFISHDLRVVRYIADRIAVMHQGRIVETGETDAVWQAPEHPYTQKLLASLPPEL